MSFIAAGGSGVQPKATIANDGFFPDIDPEEVRAAHRLDGTVTPERLRHSLIEAIASTNRELGAWKAAQILAGYQTLDAVPADMLDGESVQLSRYRRAVYSTAKASLSERYRDYDSTAAGNKKADEMENPIDDLRRDARWAINDILGISRTTVELI